jgi:hypothetical protein
MKSQRAIKIALLILSGLTSTTPLYGSPGKRAITVRFDYDFRLSPACLTPTTKKCVKLFNVYDITGGKHEWLFSIPVPTQASGLVKGITGTSQPLALDPGKHVLAVTAESADNAESETKVCTTTIYVSSP